MEDTAYDEDIAFLRLSGGAVIVPAADIPVTVKWALAMGAAQRAAIAQAGYDAFVRRSAAVGLSGCVNSLLMASGCL